MAAWAEATYVINELHKVMNVDADIDEINNRKIIQARNINGQPEGYSGATFYKYSLWMITKEE